MKLVLTTGRTQDDLFIDGQLAQSFSNDKLKKIINKIVNKQTNNSELISILAYLIEIYGDVNYLSCDDNDLVDYKMDLKYRPKE